jgi:hypothetical protein
MRDWTDILPEALAREQKDFDRYARILVAAESPGVTRVGLARAIGRTPERIRQMLARAGRRKRWESIVGRRHPLSRSPLEIHLSHELEIFSRKRALMFMAALDRIRVE